MTVRRVRIRGKTRTRQHIIADITFNHFESFVLECGYVAEPVIFGVFNAQSKRAYWLHVQEYFGAKTSKELFAREGTIAVRIPMSQRVNRRAIKKFARIRDATLPPREHER